ncbi:MAG: DUF1573 domain-containing protein [Bacteroidota bacterium]
MKKTFLLSLLCLFATVVMAQSAFQEAPTLNLEPEGAAPKAAWAEETHNFGEIPQGVPAKIKFVFTNDGDQALKISRVKASCGCTATDYSKEAVAPGEQGYVMAEYNAYGVGVFHKTITVYTNEENAVKILRIKGEVMPKSE